jgi:hypothetical protein
MEEFEKTKISLASMIDPNDLVCLKIPDGLEDYFKTQEKEITVNGIKKLNDLDINLKKKIFILHNKTLMIYFQNQLIIQLNIYQQLLMKIKI